MAGQRVACPACSQAIKVPGSKQAIEEDDWLEMDSPTPPKPTTKGSEERAPAQAKQERPRENPTPSGPKPTSNEHRTGTKDSAAPKPQSSTTSSNNSASRKPSSTSSSKPDASLNFDDELPVAKAKEEVEFDEFRVLCKVCNTLMYMRAAQIGSKAKCPDCHSEFIVAAPSVAALPKPKGKSKPVQNQNEGVEIRLAAVDGKAIEDKNPFHQSPAEILAKAARELKAQEDKEEATTSQDVFHQIRSVMGVLGDPEIAATSIFSGIAMCVVFGALSWSITSEDTFAKTVRIFVLIFATILLIPWTGYTLTGGAAILDATANRLKKVREWVSWDPTEWFADSILMFLAIAYAGTPGSLLGYLLQVILNLSSLVGVALIFLSVWILVPITILSMLQNRSFVQPVSGVVLSSMNKCGIDWMTYYFASMVSMLILFYLLVRTFSYFDFSFILFGMSLPWLINIQFHRLGALARAIAEGTEVSSEG